MAASFGAMWGTVFDQNEDAVLIATLLSNRIRVLGIQQRVTMEDMDTDDSQPLPATSSKLRPSKLKELLAGATTSNVCPDAAVYAPYPRHVLDQEAGQIIKREEADKSAVLADTPTSRRRLTMSSPLSVWSRPISQKWVLIPLTRIWREAQNGDNRR